MIYIDINKKITKNTLHCELCQKTCNCAQLHVFIEEEPIFYLRYKNLNELINSTEWLTKYNETHKDLEKKVALENPTVKTIILKPFLPNMLFKNKWKNLIKWKIKLT